MRSSDSSIVSGASAPSLEGRKNSNASSATPVHEEGFGDKSIGFWGSVCLLANNITGPGMVQIPVLFQQAGWLIPTIFFGYIGIVAGLTSLFLAKAVSQVPGNKHLNERMEFGNLAKLLFPRWLYLLSFIALIFNFQVTNMSSIVVSAQTMDSTLLASARKTCALVIWDPDGSLSTTVGVNGTTTTSSSIWTCVSADSDNIVTDSPFGSAYVISLGYLITMAITIPLGYLNLDDNIWVQYGGFILLIACIFAWVAQFGASGLDMSRMPAVQWSGMGAVIPTVVFNWGFLTTLPSWLNEKNPNVSVAKATWVSIIISGVMFILLGILGGLALDYPGGEDLLAAIDDPNTPNVMLISKIATYVFPSAALLSGIPVFSIIIRYNLLENHVMNKFWANIFAVIFPWVVSLAFYAGNALGSLINWSSAILFVGLNFVLPLMLYVSINSEKGRNHIVEKMRKAGMLTDSEVPMEDVHVKTSNHSVQVGSIQNPSSASSEYSVKDDKSWKFGLNASKFVLFSPGSKTTGKDANDTVSQEPLLPSIDSDESSTHSHRHHEHHDVDGIRVHEPMDPKKIDWSGATDIDALPSWWCYRDNERTAYITANVWLWSSSIIAVVCFILQIVSTADPSFADNS